MTPPPLAGVRVLDLSHFLAGPYAALALADLGADVIKIEDPDRPDEARTVGPHFVQGESLYFAALNWGKRSVAIRLSTPEGHAEILALARTADVLIDNYRPGVMTKLGLHHDRLDSVNDRLVTCSLTGFGETGPYAGRPGYDYTIQALAGVMSLTGEPDGPPGKAGISYVDHSGGLAAAFAICAALVERARTGKGRHIDLSLLDVQISMLSYLAAWQLNTGAEPGRTESAAHPSLVPAQNFAASDGYVSLFVGNDAMWARFLEAADDDRLRAPEYASTRGRAAARDVLVPIVGEILATRTRAEWVALFTRHGVPCAPVNQVSDALRDEHVRARGLIQAAGEGDAAYRHVAGPVPTLGSRGAQRAPRLGEHNAEVEAEL